MFETRQLWDSFIKDDFPLLILYLANSKFIISKILIKDILLVFEILNDHQGLLKM